MEGDAPPVVNAEKLAKLQRMAAGVRTGGKGSVRRKKKAAHKNAPTDDKRLQATLKRIGVNTLPNIEEVNIFREGDKIIHFATPNVQAAVGANTFVIGGSSALKDLQDMLPDIADQLSPGDLQALVAQLGGAGGAMGGMAASGATAAAADGDDADGDDDDDDVPDLVENENFETAASAATVEEVDATGS